MSSELTFAQWHSTGRRYSFQQHSLFWQAAGDGTCVLLLHGFPTASWDFHHQWRPLAERFRVITFDQLGFGFSDKPRGHHYSMVEQADIASALLSECGVSECHVLAHDYGDSVCQELLARHNERDPAAPRLKSVVFLNGGLFPEQHRPTRRQQVLLSPIGPLTTYFTGFGGFASSFSRVFGPQSKPTPEELHEFWTLICHNHGKPALARLIHYIHERQRLRDRWVGALCQTEVPLRLINGPEDPVSGRHMAEHYRRQVPQPDVVLLEGIGHYPQTEAPADVTRLSLDWFTQHS